MEIKDFDYDTEMGFAWIIIDSDKPGVEWSVQCCLADRSDEDAQNGAEFEAKIIAGNSGCDDGICGDVNEKAFDYWGQNKCMTALFNKAKKAGLEVVGF